MRKKTIILLLLFLIAVLSLKAQDPIPPPVLPGNVKPKETIAELEARLKQNPKDDDARRKILDLYDDDSQNPEAQKALRRHRLEFIRQTPNAYVSIGMLGFWNEGALSDPEFVELRDEWLKQVAADKTNKPLRFAAAEFMMGADPGSAERILLEGQQLDPEENEYYDDLIGIYEQEIERLESAYDSGENKNAEAEIRRTVEKLLAQGEKQLALYDRDEMKKTGIAKLQSLYQMGKRALELGDVKRARRFAEKIMNDYGTSNPAEADSFAVYYGYNLLGRVVLREGDRAQAVGHLAKALEGASEDDFEVYREAELDLAAELAPADGHRAALEYVRKLIKFTKDEDTLKNLRRWERKLKLGLMPFGFDN